MHGNYVYLFNLSQKRKQQYGNSLINMRIQLLDTELSVSS